jgi:parallel beta-helix repeat protein
METIFSTGSAGLIIEQSVGTKVYGNFIGTSANGASAVQNNDGIVVGFMGSDAQIGGSELFQRNIISGNLSRGVAITVGAGNNNKIESNYIGLNYSGTASILNDIGILIEGNSNTIGNFSKQSGNVISGNNAGIVITGTLNGVYGNIMGLNPSGTAKIPNNNHGMEIFGSTNYVGNDYTNLNQRNIISGNVGRGILVNGSSASSNLIYGNLIGPLADGINIPIGNQSNGIELVGGANNNEVGGATLDLGNVISGNALHGISIFNGSSFNTIRSNNIGIDKTETVAIPNGSVGIQLLTDCMDNSISNNMVARNGTNGIEINSSNNNIILDNVIGCNRDVTANFGNTESGITLFNSSGTYIEENNIHSNGLFGIDMLGSNGTQIYTNFIGGNASSLEPFVGSGNANRGIYVDQSDSVQIGDGTNSRANYIKFNGGNGIEISGGSSLVQHTYNFISNNSGLGIDIDADGVSVVPTDNEGAQAPVFTE